MTKSILGKKAGRVRSEDGRSAESVLLRKTIKRLTTHLGGNPSVPQQMLIQRAAMLTMHLARQDVKALAAGEMAGWSEPNYLAWTNTLARTLAQLGVAAAPEVDPGAATDLAAYIASKTPTPAASASPDATGAAE